jgi:hypothetical protein
MLRSHGRTQATPHVTINRRRTTRYEVRERLVAYLLKEQLPVRVRDLGTGGFAIETVEPLPVARTYHVRFTATDNTSAVLPAQALHSRPSCSADGAPCFVTGFSFLDGQIGQADRIIRRLIDKVTTGTVFD